MKTAIQQAYKDILDIPEIMNNMPMSVIQKITSVMNKHLETEKQQIIEAHSSGFCDTITPEDYFEKTYSNNQ